MRAIEQWALHSQCPAGCADKPMLMTCRELACVGAGVEAALSHFLCSDGGYVSANAAMPMSWLSYFAHSALHGCRCGSGSLLFLMLRGLVGADTAMR